VGVRCSTVEAGNATAGQHYKHTSGVVYFEVGASIAHLTVPLINNSRWEAVRDFHCCINEIVDGKGVIGDCHSTVCMIVDDDLYPVGARAVRAPFSHSRNSDSCAPFSRALIVFTTRESATDAQSLRGSTRTDLLRLFSTVRSDAHTRPSPQSIRVHAPLVHTQRAMPDNRRDGRREPFGRLYKRQVAGHVALLHVGGSVEPVPRGVRRQHVSCHDHLHRPHLDSRCKQQGRGGARGRAR